ncbi:MAG: alpha/beta fold hydrolase [Clostridium sp.]
MIYDSIKGNGKSDILLLFVHGSGCNKKFLRYLAEQFPNYDRLLVDLPGHGDDKSTDYSYKNYINSLVDFIGEYNDRKVVVLGHSLGGTLTIDIASRNLQNVIAAVSLSGGASFPDMIKEDFMNLIHEGKCPPECLIPYADLQYPQVVKAMETIEPEHVIVNDFLIDEKVDITSQLEDIKTPLLLVTGGDDTLVKYEYSHLVYLKARKYSTLLAIPGFKHMLCLACNDVIVPALEKFIAHNSHAE